MGATDIFRSIALLRFSEEMPIFAGLSMFGVGAGFLCIVRSLPFAEATKRRHDQSPEYLSPPATLRWQRSNTAEGRLRKGKAVVYREIRTFTLRTAAKSWAKCREVALENPDELARAQEDLGHAEAEDYGLRKLIRWYIDTFRAISKWGRSKQTTLEFLERHALANEDARKLSAARIIKHTQGRRRIYLHRLH
jgi:hypothetical protein